MEIRADGQRNGGWREHELDQCRHAGDVSAHRAERPLGVGEGPPACGIEVVSSVKLKMNVVYIAATKADVTRKPSVPAFAQP